MKICKYLALLLLLPIATVMAAPGPGFGPGGGIIEHTHTDAATGGDLALSRIVYKPADTARSSTTTMTDDPDLILTNVVPGHYAIELTLTWRSPVAEDFKFDFENTASAFSWEMFCTSKLVDNTIVTGDFARVVGIGTWVTDILIDGQGASAKMFLNCHGKFDQTSTTTVSFRWAQQTSGAGVTTVDSSSWMRITRLGDT